MSTVVSFALKANPSLQPWNNTFCCKRSGYTLFGVFAYCMLPVNFF
ncbi:hypothetical protein SAMN05216383_11614 [Prevotella sp. KH2C16]|nr:hypothetical protein SAMN05216383_11614 [Prevotella sp. KH2C16]